MDDRFAVSPARGMFKLSVRCRMALAIALACALAVASAGLTARWCLREMINGAIIERHFLALVDEYANRLQRQAGLESAVPTQVKPSHKPRPRAMIQRGSASGRSTRQVGGPPGFIVLNTSGQILQGSDQFPIGRTMPLLLRFRQRAIALEGTTLAYAIPAGKPPLDEEHRAMLSMFDRALWFGAPGAAVISALLSMLLSHRIDSAHKQLKDSERSFSNQASKLRELSIRDDLTGLYNRRHFNQQVKKEHESALRNNRPLCLVMVDIDHFKRINDRFGHAVGDAVLSCIGTLFRDNIRSGDLAARIGGEEFVVVFPETSIDDAGSMCERLCLMVSAYPWDTIAEGLSVTISMGLYGGSGPASCDDMLRIADRYLYRAKASGRNRLVACKAPPSQR